MRRYYSEQKRAIILKRVLPPLNESISKVSREEGVPVSTLGTWKKKQGEMKRMVPKIVKKEPQLTAEARFSIIVETAVMSEAALSAYCREKGLYPQQIKAWKAEFLSGVAPTFQLSYKEKQEAKRDQKRIRELEKELRRKEKALAEAAALLVLRKKLRAFYGEENEDD